MHPTQVPRVDDTVRAMRSVVDGPTTTVVSNPIHEGVLRLAARQAGVPDDQPIPGHIRAAAEVIARAYDQMDVPVASEEVATRFLTDSLSTSTATDVRLSVLALASLADVLQDALRVMREEVTGGGDYGAFHDASPEAIWRAYQTHVVSSLDLIEQARQRVDAAYSRYQQASGLLSP